VKPEILFDNYLYMSGTSAPFVTHCRDLAIDVINEYARRGALVLDVACNDGTLMKAFRRMGCEVWGVDPADNLKDVTVKQQLTVLVDYWRDGTAAKLPGNFDIITATNVLAHVPNPRGFIEECFKALSDSGVVIVEFPYCKNLLKNNEFDTVYHEHLSYFTINSFSTLIRTCNPKYKITIDRVLFTPIHGGSVRFFLRRSDNLRSNPCNGLIRAEREQKLFDLAEYMRFAWRCEVNVSALKNYISHLRQAGHKLIGFGASAKGNTMLNTAEIKYPVVDYIVDDTPTKWGLRTPGSNIPIVEFEQLIEEKEPVTILMLAWNFGEEIERKVNEVCDVNHKFLYYVPQVHQNECTVP
jgi:SAM-dependent methyltransferase